MDIKRKIVYPLSFFILITTIAVFAFLGMKKYDAAKQKNAPVTAEKLTPAENIPEAELTEAIEDSDTEKSPTNITENEEMETVQQPTEEEMENKKTEELSANLPIYSPVKRSSDEITIGFITDLHVVNSGANSLQSVFTNRINRFVEKMNNETVPDFMLINGDTIEGTKTPAATGKMELQLAKNLFNRSAIQKYWVLGNHDLRSVTKQQWKDALGINYLKKSFEVRDYKIIILDSNFNKNNKDTGPGEGYTRGKVSSSELSWLRNELKDTHKKTLVFIHHPPLWNVDFKTNDWLLENARELKNIFSKYNVLAVFSGHIEALYHKKIDGVNYFVLPGIYKNTKYPGAFSVINIKKNDVEVELNYLKNTNAYTTKKLKN